MYNDERIKNEGLAQADLNEAKVDGVFDDGQVVGDLAHVDRVPEGPRRAVLGHLAPQAHQRHRLHQPKKK